MGIPTRLPAALSERLASASASLYSRQGREFDVAIGGIPFMLATSAEIPQTVETVPVRKDQTDVEPDPGEQSLSGWWRRSQASFHKGAGALYAENNLTNEPGEGFWDSSGIDVFTPGQIKLLRKMERSGSDGATLGLGKIKTFSSTATRANLCTNPSFGVDTTGWVTSAGGGPAGDEPTLTRVDPTAEGIGAAPSGGFVGKLTWATDDGTGFPPSLAAPVAAVSTDVTHSIQISVYVPTGSTNVVVLAEGEVGTGAGGVKDEWVTLTMQISSADATLTPTIWPSTPVSPGEVFYVDTCIVEESNHFGSYFDGDFPDCSWTGTTGLSTSIYSVSAASPSKSAVGGGKLYSATNFDDGFTEVHAPAGKTIVDGVISGTTFYDVASDGTLYQGDVSAPLSATDWACGATPSRLSWGKHRLWVLGGRKLWQPDLTLADGSAQSPIFTHPNLGWTYTCMTEGPAAMYFGGHDGFTSSIQAVTLDSGGGLPTLSGATVTAVLPQGELVQELTTVAGSFIGIGTNRGLRIGVVDPGQTSITYGPLLIEPEGIVRCTALTAQGRFFVVAFETEASESVAYRVDTSIEVAEGGVFAYAKDIELAYPTSITSLAVAGTSLLATSQDGQPWHQSATDLVEIGWIQSGRVRFRTNEPKAFKFLDIEIEPLNGAIACEAILEGDSTLTLGSVTRQGEVFDEALSIDIPPLRYLSPKFTLTRSTTDASQGPVFNSYLLRAQPAVKPQRLIRLPLLCFDREQARSGQQYGGVGYARDRLTALQLLEDTGESLIFQDFSLEVASGQIVMIDAMRFVQTSPPSPHRQEGAGGILVVELRTVEA